MHFLRGLIFVGTDVRIFTRVFLVSPDKPPYGIPTAPENNERQHRIEIRLEGIPIPIIGYKDFAFDGHGLDVDLKTTARMPEDMSQEHQLQAAIYWKASGNRAQRFCYATKADHKVLELSAEAAQQQIETATARGASALIGVSRVIETLFGMSKKDAERHNIRENLRHLYVRLDDAKANLSLASPEAKWFKRIGVVIANTDEVGVLEPVTLDDRLLHSISDQDDTNHTIIASLAAQVKEDVLTLNAAAIRLAWGGSARFVEYRQQDDKGHQRASKTLRNMIENACRANKVIVTGTEACGFVIDNTVRPVVIKRFSRPAEASDLAAQPPDFPDTDDMEDDHDF